MRALTKNEIKIVVAALRSAYPDDIRESLINSGEDSLASKSESTMQFYIESAEIKLMEKVRKYK